MSEADKHISHTPDELFAILAQKAARYLSGESIAKLRAAYEFADKAHNTQRRKSGEPYITHPLAVAEILTDFKLDEASLLAAILHDTVEDTDVKLADVAKIFGDEVASLVDGLTKIAKVKFQSNQDKLAENFRKMIVAMAKDLRVIVVKLADRLHNMRTISALPAIKAARISQETLDIYAPLASRLGIYGIKSELEDSCLRQLKPEIYADIKRKVAAKKTHRNAQIDEVVSILSSEMRRYEFKSFEVYGRPKHFYSIYKKMLHRKHEFEDIHDLFAYRIIVDSIKDCYEALGIVHAMWKPMPGRFKDYIAMPKANMYQSLHTTVVRPNGEPAEIQIRTREMQKVCEFGVAAHWAYKEKNQQPPGADSSKFSWLRQIMQWQNELSDPDEFLEAVKVDLFEEEIFVFTPKGDVISLPRNATALDFAFGVHTELGTKTISAKVNATIAPLKKVLKSGDIVEIITSPQQRPSKDWLNFVITSKARNKIRSYLRKDQRDLGRSIGSELLDAALATHHLSLDKIQGKDTEELLCKAARESTIEDVLIQVGYGKLDAKELVRRVFDEDQNSNAADLTSSQISTTAPLAEGSYSAKSNDSSSAARSARNKHGVLVSGIHDVMVNLAKCCNPLPGEVMIGFITLGKGVTVHRANCSRALDLDPHRRIDVSWSLEAVKSTHAAFVRVLTRDRVGVLAEVTQVIKQLGANINQADIRVNAEMIGHLDFELAINDLAQLEALIHKIECIPGVLSVERRNILRK